MKLSTRGRYALRLMLDLAVYDTGEPIRLKDVAARQEISEKYLEQIIALLNKAGYVRSVRGAQGGYTLSRRPEEYTVGDILTATEGSLSPTSCVEDREACDRIDHCVTIRVYDRIAQAVSDVVNEISLADMVSWHEELAGNDFQI